MSADEKLVHDVVLLATQGMSRRAISRALKVGRNTVHQSSDVGSSLPSRVIEVRGVEREVVGQLA